METWTKLFSSILDSSVWDQDKDTKIVWITMLAKKDFEGFVRGTVGSIAAHSRLTPEECEKAITNLESPDPKSRTTDCEGRRIQPVAGGWMVINHFKYRDEIGKEALREYWRRKKELERKKSRRKKPISSTAAERVYVKEYQENGPEAAEATLPQG